MDTVPIVKVQKKIVITKKRYKLKICLLVLLTLVVIFVLIITIMFNNILEAIYH